MRNWNVAKMVRSMVQANKVKPFKIFERVDIIGMRASVGTAWIMCINLLRYPGGMDGSKFKFSLVNLEEKP